MGRYEEHIEELKRKMENKDKRSLKIKLPYAKKHYLERIKRGDYTVSVDVWDEFEKERIHEEIKVEKEEINMSERRVLVRLSKDYNVAEVEVSNILTQQEFDVEKKWAREQALALVDSYEVNTLKKQPKEYVEQNYDNEKPSATPSRVYNSDIKTKYLKGKQVDIAVKGINEGKFTLDQVNSLNGWDEMQSLIFGK